VNVLDENIRDDQRLLLRKWKISFQHIGKELSRSGIKDENVIPLLHDLRRVTFFTQDRDFFRQRLCHHAYALVYLDVRYSEVAECIRSFLKHRTFNTQKQWMGLVATVLPDGAQFWCKGARGLLKASWDDE
jgi:hypothetical protein